MNSKSDRARAGFTLIEMLVVLCLLTILLALALPALQLAWRQGKIRGAAQETSAMMRLARLTAVKTNSQGVVRIVPAVAGSGLPAKVEAFSDRDSNGVFGAGDRVLGVSWLPTGITFTAPPDLTGAASIEGFSPDPGSGSLPSIAIFQRDGSIRATGAFRFADTHGNFLEVRVDPAATARIELRKAREEGSNWNFYASGDGGQAWEWK